MSADSLKNYLHTYGILTCNSNPHLPCLEDVGCCWNDVTALIDSHSLFYCKAFKKRTTYLSGEAYFLLKQCATAKPLTPGEQRVYGFLAENPAMETAFIRQMTCFSAVECTRHVNSLLERMEITALKNGQRLNDNWSTFLYGTAQDWEFFVQSPPACHAPEERLWEILGKTMGEKEFLKLVR